MRYLPLAEADRRDEVELVNIVVGAAGEGPVGVERLLVGLVDLAQEALELQGLVPSGLAERGEPLGRRREAIPRASPTCARR